MTSRPEDQLFIESTKKLTKNTVKICPSKEDKENPK